MGTHAELMARGGLYARLYQHDLEAASKPGGGDRLAMERTPLGIRIYRYGDVGAFAVGAVPA